MLAMGITSKGGTVTVKPFVQPALTHVVQKAHEVFETVRLHTIIVDPKLTGFVDVGLQLRRGQDHDRHGVKLTVIAEPFQDVKPVHPGHLQVQQHQPRDRVFVSLSKISSA